MNRRRRAAFFGLALAPAAVVFAAPAPAASAVSTVVPPAEAIDDSAARLALAEAYTRLGRFAEAERVYETALAATAAVLPEARACQPVQEHLNLLRSALRDEESPLAALFAGKTEPNEEVTHAA